MDYKAEIDEVISSFTSESLSTLDSITFIKLIVKLEEKFNFEFDDEKLLLNAFASRDELYEYIYEKSPVLNPALGGIEP